MNHKERSFEDLMNSAEAKDYFFRVERELFPKMQASAMSLTIVGSKPDVKLALEVGAAVLFDKPLLLVVLKGAKVPKTLRRVAHIIVEVSGVQTEEDQKKISDAIRALMETQRG